MTDQKQNTIFGATVHELPFCDALYVVGRNVAVLLDDTVYTFPKPEIDFSRTTTTTKIWRGDDEIRVRLTMRFL